MEPITNYYTIVENIITKLGVDPATCRGEKPGQWNLKKGSASVWVDCWKLDEQDYGYLQIMAPVSEVPAENREAFLLEILEANHYLYGSGFTKYKEWIYIKTVRELEGMDEAEATAMFQRIGTYADEWDDRLKEKYFGGGSRPPQ